MDPAARGHARLRKCYPPRNPSSIQALTLPLVLVLASLLVAATDASTISTRSYVAASESPQNGMGSRSPATLALGKDDSALRFDSVAVPVGATILAAHVRFVASAARSQSMSVEISGELSAYARPLTGADNQLSSRSRTVARVSWSPAGVANGETLQTPDLSILVAENVALPTWFSGAPLTLHIGCDAGNKFRNVHAATSDPSLQAELYLEFTAPAPSPPPALRVLAAVASRTAVESTADTSVDLDTDTLHFFDETAVVHFAALGLPAGAQVQSAVLVLTSTTAGTRALASPLPIRAETAASARWPLAAAPANLTARQWSAASLDWTVPTWPTAWANDADLTTPDLSTVIQDVLDTAGATWSPATPLTLIFEAVAGGTGSPPPNPRYAAGTASPDPLALDARPLLLMTYIEGPAEGETPSPTTTSTSTTTPAPTLSPIMDVTPRSTPMSTATPSLGPAPTPSPTTGAPTTSPTTPAPTASPTTAAPTTAAPSMQPTPAPTPQPTEAYVPPDPCAINPCNNGGTCIPSATTTTTIATTSTTPPATTTSTATGGGKGKGGGGGGGPPANGGNGNGNNSANGNNNNNNSSAPGSSGSNGNGASGNGNGLGNSNSNAQQAAWLHEAMTCACPLGFSGEWCESPTVCPQFSGDLHIDTPAALAELASHGCGALPGSLTLAGLDFADPAVETVLPGLRSISTLGGYLRLVNCSNIDLGLLSNLKSIALDGHRHLYLSAFAVHISNTAGLNATGAQLHALLQAAHPHHVAVYGNPGFCPNDLVASVPGDPLWWALQGAGSSSSNMRAARASSASSSSLLAPMLLAFEVHPSTTCPAIACPMHLINMTTQSQPSLCVSQCVECPVVCRGAVLSTASGVRGFVGERSQASFLQLSQSAARNATTTETLAALLAGRKPSSAACVRVAGALQLDGLSKGAANALPNALAKVTTVDGALVVSNNKHVVTLRAITALRTAASILLTDNTNLTNALLPNLHPGVHVSVHRTPQLCPSAYPHGTAACGRVATAQSVAIALATNDTATNSNTSSSPPLALELRFNATAFLAAITAAASRHGGLPPRAVVVVDGASLQVDDPASSSRRRRSTSSSTSSTNEKLLVQYRLVVDAGDTAIASELMERMVADGDLVAALNAETSTSTTTAFFDDNVIALSTTQIGDLRDELVQAGYNDELTVVASEVVALGSGRLRLALNWSLGNVSTNDIAPENLLGMELFYRPAPDAAILAAIDSFLARRGLPSSATAASISSDDTAAADSDGKLALAAAVTVYDRVLPWQRLWVSLPASTADITAVDQTVTLPRSTRGGHVSTPSAFDIFLVLHTTNRTGAFAAASVSPVVRAAVRSASIQPTNLTVTASPNPMVASSPEIALAWTIPPLADGRDLSQLQVLVSLRYARVGNARDLGALGNKGAAFVHELFLSAQRTRPVSPISALAATLSGCFALAAPDRDETTNSSTHCLAPYTLYRIAVRVRDLSNAATSTSSMSSTTVAASITDEAAVVYFATPQAPPDASAVLSAGDITVTDVQATAASVAIRLPKIGLNGPLLQYHLNLTSTASGSDSHQLSNITSTRTAEAQATFPDATEVVVIGDLLPHTAYTLRVALSTPLGVTPFGPVSWTFQTAAATPLQMPPPAVAVLANGSAIASWTQPPATVLRDAATNVEYELLLDSTPLYRGAALSFMLPPFVHPALVAGASTLTVRAHNSVGQGPVSASAIVQSPSTSGKSSAGDSSAMQIGVLGAAGLVVLVVVLVLLLRRRRRAVHPPYLALEKDDWELDEGKVSLQKEVGRGAFGLVWRAKINVGALPHGLGDSRHTSGPVTVAVKMCSNRDLDAVEKGHFRAEIELMKRFAYPPHKNVVRLLGACVTREPMFAVMEYFEHGDLQALLRQCRPTTEEPGLISLRDRLRMAADVASGMVYLSMMGFIHRDLACRNIFVGSSLVAKVGDLGMSRVLDAATNKNYYKKAGKIKLPVRWMAPETITLGRFSTASDIWSFGIVLWEITSWGIVPYPGKTNWQVIDELVAGNGGQKLIGPPMDDCPEAIWEIMGGCWNQEPIERTDFRSVLRQITAVTDALGALDEEAMLEAEELETEDEEVEVATDSQDDKSCKQRKSIVAEAGFDAYLRYGSSTTKNLKLQKMGLQLIKRGVLVENDDPGYYIDLSLEEARAWMDSRGQVKTALQEREPSCSEHNHSGDDGLGGKMGPLIPVLSTESCSTNSAGSRSMADTAISPAPAKRTGTRFSLGRAFGRARAGRKAARSSLDAGCLRELPEDSAPPSGSDSLSSATGKQARAELDGGDGDGKGAGASVGKGSSADGDTASIKSGVTPTPAELYAGVMARLAPGDLLPTNSDTLRSTGSNGYMELQPGEYNYDPSSIGCSTGSSAAPSAAISRSASWTHGGTKGAGFVDNEAGEYIEYVEVDGEAQEVRKAEDGADHDAAGQENSKRELELEIDIRHNVHVASEHADGEREISTVDSGAGQSCGSGSGDDVDGTEPTPETGSENPVGVPIDVPPTSTSTSTSTPGKASSSYMPMNFSMAKRLLYRAEAGSGAGAGAGAGSASAGVPSAGTMDQPPPRPPKRKSSSRHSASSEGDGEVEGSKSRSECERETGTATGERSSSGEPDPKEAPAPVRELPMVLLSGYKPPAPGSDIDVGGPARQTAEQRKNMHPSSRAGSLTALESRLEGPMASRSSLTLTSLRSSQGSGSELSAGSGSESKAVTLERFASRGSRGSLQGMSRSGSADSGILGGLDRDGLRSPRPSNLGPGLGVGVNLGTNAIVQQLQHPGLEPRRNMASWELFESVNVGDRAGPGTGPAVPTATPPHAAAKTSARRQAPKSPLDRSEGVLAAALAGLADELESRPPTAKRTGKGGKGGKRARSRVQELSKGRASPVSGLDSAYASDQSRGVSRAGSGTLTPPAMDY